ncbi:4-hydroxythreonine-4-phosphate dehydrogenase [Flavobacteriaceae bacterium MAR_2010_188]|nr:4-hydroxythreonine-4-phosphate dehydrogenase [Flavobacteriaceae bacterium MAR_2010_188]
MKKDEILRVGISVGDLNGIGSEIILKTFEDERMLDFCTPIIFASTHVMNFFNKFYKSQINFNPINNFEEIKPGKVNVYNVWKDQIKIDFGEESKEMGKYSILSLESATKALKECNIDVLVTAPINKSNIQSEDFKFPGHTDYLARELGGDSLMFMITENLRIGLLTDHVPVKDVPSQISESVIDKKINTIIKTLVQDFQIPKPKIAVLSINPHAGDNGVIGTEDDAILRPKLKKLQEEGKLVYGPYSADSFFGSQNYKNFDATIASYHDQGLIPFKTLSFGRGVNYTAGLTRIRTSPDHGTAYEIAGKGEANENSFKEAVFAAIKIFKTRKQYLHNSKNALKSQPKKR